jgi:hypothetical protein
MVHASHDTRPLRRLPAVLLVVAAAAGAFAGCGGSSSSSKPAYCSDKSALSTAVNGLSSPPSVNDVTGVATEVANVGSAFKGFSDAASSKC